jgi:site-specific DNA-methyltransferase (adenine-specific)
VRCGSFHGAEDGGGAGVSHQRNGIATPKDEWQTPQWLFDLLDREFQFHVDAAATGENAKASIYYGDALNHEWYHQIESPDDNLPSERFFLNPPYSAGNIDKFMAKAYEESQKGAVVVCLVPCATDTRWWHNYAMKAQEIRFIKGRVRFVGYDKEGKQIKNSPTFSSCVVIFRPNCAKYFAGGPEAFTPLIGKTIEHPRSAPA